MPPVAGLPARDPSVTVTAAADTSAAPALRQVPTTEVTATVETPRLPAGPRQLGDVATFAVAWLDRGTPGSGPALDEVTAIYTSWCEGRNFRALPVEIFRAQLAAFLASGNVPGIGVADGVVAGLKLRTRENVAGVRQVLQRSAGMRQPRSAVGG